MLFRLLLHLIVDLGLGVVEWTLYTDREVSYDYHF